MNGLPGEKKSEPSSGALSWLSSMLQGTLAQAPRSRAWDKDSVQWLTGGKLSEEGGPGSQDVILSKD